MSDFYRRRLFDFLMKNVGFSLQFACMEKQLFQIQVHIVVATFLAFRLKSKTNTQRECLTLQTDQLFRTLVILILCQMGSNGRLLQQPLSVATEEAEIEEKNRCKNQGRTKKKFSYFPSRGCNRREWQYVILQYERESTAIKVDLQLLFQVVQLAGHQLNDVTTPTKLCDG